MNPLFRRALGMMGSVLCLQAHAQSVHLNASVCNSSAPTQRAEYAAQLACAEHQLWREPFIDAQGRLRKIGPMEAERDRLADGTPAWRRVWQYWQLGVGAQDLFRGEALPPEDDSRDTQRRIRTQLIDTPWSGAFISYLMRMAGFNASEFAFADGHIRYIKPAYQPEPAYAWAWHDPRTTAMRVGDLLCYAREAKRVFGVADFQAWLEQHAHDETSLKMHCDIVVGVQSRRAYTVGGNVAQAVTLRVLPLNRQGGLSAQVMLPPRSGSWLVEALGDADETARSCRPQTPQFCHMNRQDWVALLRYREPQSANSAITPSSPSLMLPPPLP